MQAFTRPSIRSIGIHTKRGLFTALLAALTAGGSGVVLAASDHGHEAHAEPVPVGAELAERCEDYREDLEFTRAQLSRQNVLGRWDFVRTQHRKREKFVNEHCGGAASGDDGHGGDHAGGQRDDHHG
ncbi:MAG TPA: hypothetical protein VLA56_05080 [Pseudomonadales bacterium]|nr:hypothetical protein [Pseudomonadales bacterium]